MQTQLLFRKRRYLPLAGFLFACSMATAQNWVPSSSPGAPVVPFDALITGRGAAPPFLPKPPLYTCRGGRPEGYGLQVGQFAPGSAGCAFSYGGVEVSVPDFEFLVTSWQPASGGFVPPNAVQGGWDSPAPGSNFKPPLYYCRGNVKAKTTVSLQLGKIRPGFGACFVPYSGKELAVGSYEVLVALSPAMPLASVKANNGFVPQDAIRAGVDDDGSPLYICAAFFSDGTHPGKLHSSFGGCNISYAGVEHTVSDYFVLVPDWLGSSKFDFPAGIDTDGSPLSVCRAFLNGGFIYPGKIRSTWSACSFGLSGKEQWGSLYEILSH